MLSTSSYFFNRKDILRILNLLLSYFISASILISALFIFNTNENLSNPENLTNFILIISIAAGIEFGFTKSYLVKSNKEVLEYFDYEVSGDLKNSELLDTNGLFVGNHQVDIKDKIQNFFNVISHNF